jgi:hypothetical protein
MKQERMKRLFLTGLVALAGVAFQSRASMSLPLPIERHLQLAQAVCRGTVLRLESYKDPTDGHLYTRTHVRVDEGFKGKFPAVVLVVHRGGRVGAEGELDGWAPQFKVGEERLLFLARQRNGTLQALNGGASALKLQRAGTDLLSGRKTAEPEFVAADAALLAEVRLQSVRSADPGINVMDQAGADPDSFTEPPPAPAPAAATVATNLLVDEFGNSSRFLAPDRGEPIPYLVDADALPTGITQTQAIDAVKSALNAWAAVTSLKFTFEGVQSFGQAAANVTTSGGKIRIQLHDLYGYITGPITLGQGGRDSVRDFTSSGWGNGGRVIGNEFNESTAGYLTLKHTNAALRTLATFTEVLCHELGHVLSLAHSSETYPEPNPTLREAMMYFLVHADGRGATLGTWDPPVIRQVHPTGNTPPYTHRRVMDIVTFAFGEPSVSGLNEVQLRGYDLQSTNLALATSPEEASYGSFSLTGNRLKFTADNLYDSQGRLDPAGGGYYDRMAARFSDGTNASPSVYVRTISLNPDTEPFFDEDGLPDDWMITYWGDADPGAGANRDPADDYDDDGFTNWQEYLLGSSPIDRNSNLRILSISPNSLQWQAKAYELYEIHSSTNLKTWTRVLNPVVPATNVGVVTGLTNNGANAQFFRVLKVP